MAQVPKKKRNIREEAARIVREGISRRGGAAFDPTPGRAGIIRAPQLGPTRERARERARRSRGEGRRDEGEVLTKEQIELKQKTAKFTTQRGIEQKARLSGAG